MLENFQQQFPYIVLKSVKMCVWENQLVRCGIRLKIQIQDTSVFRYSYKCRRVGVYVCMCVCLCVCVQKLILKQLTFIKRAIKLQLHKT